MARWKRHINTNLFQKLILVLSILVLLIGILGLYGNKAEQQTIRDTVIESLESKVVFYLSSLESEVRRLQSITYSYMNDIDFMKLAMVYDSLSDYQRTDLILRVQDKMRDIKAISEYVENIYLYLPQVPRSVNALNSDYELSQDQIDALMDPKQLTHMVVNDRGKLLVRSHMPTGLAANKLPDMMLALEISQDEVSSMLAGVETGEAASALLIGPDWCVQPPNVKFSADELMSLISAIPLRGSAQGTQTSHWRGDEYLFVWRRADSFDATLIVYIPQRNVLAALWTAEMWLYALIGFTVIVLLGMALVLYRVVHMPMRRMVNAFKQVERGDHNVRLAVLQNDEFGYLYHQFNKMMDTVNNLIRQVYEQRILSQESQLKQLQSQINPHFFYNSFFALKGLIDMGDRETASLMLSSLGNYFQFITRSGKDFVTLEREVAHARAYCDIQQLRFHNIRVDFAPPPEDIRERVVPRLILQPLIENAYIYALETKPGDGALAVWFEWQPPLLLIHVTDDGEAVNPEVIEQLCEQLDKSDAVGMEVTALLNIHRRLRLYYGSAGGLSVLMNEPAGMHVIVSLPEREEV